MGAVNDSKGVVSSPGEASTTVGPAVLRAEGLVKRYGDRMAVDGVDLAIAPGECLGLLGPNGAGKTTTILMICGLLEPDRGRIALGAEGLSVRSPAARRSIGYVPQEIAVYDDLTARENLRFFAALYGLARRETRPRVEEVLDFVDLRGRADDRVGTFSGGMKRRLNIAIALLHRPALLVLDEPTVGVDPHSRNAMLDGLQRLRDDGLALLYSSHYMEEVERLADRVGVMDEGRLLVCGTRRELLERLEDGGRRIRLTCRPLPADAVRVLTALPGVTAVQATGDELDVLSEAPAGALPRILAALSGSGASVGALSVEEPDLETVFLHLTGKALRDG